MLIDRLNELWAKTQDPDAIVLGLSGPLTQWRKLDEIDYNSQWKNPEQFFAMFMWDNNAGQGRQRWYSHRDGPQAYKMPWPEVEDFAVDAGLRARWACIGYEYRMSANPFEVFKC